MKILSGAGAPAFACLIAATACGGTSSGSAETGDQTKVLKSESEKVQEIPPLQDGESAFDDLSNVQLYDVSIGMPYEEALQKLEERGFKISSKNKARDPGKFNTRSYFLNHLDEGDAHKVLVLDYTDAEGVQRVWAMSVSRKFSEPRSSEPYKEKLIERYGPPESSSLNWVAVSPWVDSKEADAYKQCAKSGYRSHEDGSSLFNYIDAGDPCVELMSRSAEELADLRAYAAFSEVRFKVNKKSGMKDYSYAYRPSSSSSALKSVKIKHLYVNLDSKWHSYSFGPEFAWPAFVEQYKLGEQRWKHQIESQEKAVVEVSDDEF